MIISDSKMGWECKRFRDYASSLPHGDSKEGEKEYRNRCFSKIVGIVRPFIWGKYDIKSVKCLLSRLIVEMFGLGYNTETKIFIDILTENLYNDIYFKS